MNLFNFIPGYTTYIFQTGREPAFIMLLSFILTYIFTRGYTRIARIRGWGSASFGGVHTHHMVFGLIASFIAGALLFALTPEQGPLFLLLAAIFGSGAALVLDEFALIFHLQDVYWENEGRKSVDAVVLAVAFGSLFLFRASPFGIQSSDSELLLFASVAVNFPVVLIAAAKGKIYIALFGVFIPTLSLIGAVRLAEPDSLWARHVYRKGSRKLVRSRQRYDQYERVWRTRKERIWDIIGGKIGRPVK